MKKKYEKPEVFTEDVGTAFVQTCCKDVLATPNAYFGGYCTTSCNPGSSNPYAQA